MYVHDQTGLPHSLSNREGRLLDPLSKGGSVSRVFQAHTPKNAGTPCECIHLRILVHFVKESRQRQVHVAGVETRSSRLNGSALICAPMGLPSRGGPRAAMRSGCVAAASGRKTHRHRSLEAVDCRCQCRKHVAICCTNHCDVSGCQS